MLKLPEQFRTAIVLREVEGLSYEEIGVLTKTEMGTVKSRIARARTKLQELLKPYLESTNTATEVSG
jgi:RNA polymerase sigma-70 factor (ECF subfamily)